MRRRKREKREAEENDDDEQKAKRSLLPLEGYRMAGRPWVHGRVRRRCRRSSVLHTCRAPARFAPKSNRSERRERGYCSSPHGAGRGADTLLLLHRKELKSLNQFEARDEREETKREAGKGED
jgi:hypothetical protein